MNECPVCGVLDEQQMQKHRIIYELKNAVAIIDKAIVDEVIKRNAFLSALAAKR